MKITKKIISVLLSLALVLGVSATAFAATQVSVTYYIGETVVKTDSVSLITKYKPTVYAPDLRPDLVPENSYFTGWYTNAECTGTPISPDGAYAPSDGMSIYAGFKQYESSFTPHYSTEGFERFDMNRIQVFYPRMMGTTFVPNIQNTKGSKTTTTTDTEGDYVWRLLVSEASPYFFYDENAVAYQVKTDVSYKVSFQYKYEFPATNTTEVFFEVGIGSKISNFTSDGKMTGDANSYKYRQRVEKIIPSRQGPTAITNWETVELVLPALTEADLEEHYPILGFRTTHCSNEGLIDIKNLVVEEIIQEEFSVVYHYLGEDGKETEKVVKDGIELNQNYAIDWVANNTNEEYFVGWYANEACTGNPVTSIKLTVDGKNHIYAGYKEYKTTFSPVFQAIHAEDYASTYMPSMHNGAYYPRTTIVNYSTGGITKVTDADGDYYSIVSNGSTMIFFPDENDVAYQAKPGAQYKITLTYKSGNGSFKLNGAIGMPKSAVSGPIPWGLYPNAYRDSRTAAAFSAKSVTVSDIENWNTATLIVDASAVDYSQNSAQIGIFLDEFTAGKTFHFKDIVVCEIDTNANEEAFVSFENHINFSKNAVLDETNNYAIAQNTAEHTVWENANLDGVWANPVKKEKIYTVFGGSGFAPENFAIVNGGMNSEKALKFKQTASGTKYKVADISNGVFLNDNTTYTATFYYKAEGSSSSDLKFSIVNAVNSEMLGMITSANTVVIPANQVASDWTKVVLTFTTDFGYHNADYAISSEMFCIPVLCVNYDIDDTARTVYVDSVSLETSINCGGVSVLDAQAEAEEGAQALRVYFNYLPDENGKITIGGETVSVAKRGVLLAPATKLNNKTDKDGNFIREKIETPNFFVKENAENYGFILSEKADNLSDCWSNENGVLTYSVYIKNLAINDDKEIAVRGYIELSDGRVIYSDIYNYSVNNVKLLNNLGKDKTYTLQ